MKAIERGTAAIPVSRIKMKREFENVIIYPHSTFAYVTARGAATRKHMKRKPAQAPLTDHHMRILRVLWTDVTEVIIRVMYMRHPNLHHLIELLKENHSTGTFCFPSTAKDIYKLYHTYQAAYGDRIGHNVCDKLQEYCNRYETMCRDLMWDPQLDQPILPID